jgi:molybdopterin converting factor small subunit
VLLPTPLADYTAHRREVEAEGATLAEVMRDLDRRYPGLRFRVIDEQDRIRPHMRLFLGNEPVADLARKVGARDELYVLGALSGG